MFEKYVKKACEENREEMGYRALEYLKKYYTVKEGYEIIMRSE